MGITGTHYQQVSAMVENEVTMSSQKIESNVPERKAGVKTTEMVMASQASTSSVVPLVEQASGMSSRELDARETALMEILREIRREQKHIRSQISDTNRDMDELTFRVDSHSTQFRPLQTQAGTPRALVVPDDEFGSAVGSGGLLPPKQ